MTDPSIEFTNKVSVNLMGASASDASVVAAARVSTEGVQSMDYLSGGDGAGKGLINYLMKNRHGSPFEHNHFMFYVHAPIFVFREFQRHRIGFSYNEESGRYKKLDPIFYIPGISRDLVQVGKPGEYQFKPGTSDQYRRMASGHMLVASVSYKEYLRQLDDGICREVARMSLPLNIMSSMYVTCNARSIMAFLALRTKRSEATFPSSPMREIEMVAEQIEDSFEELMPTTYQTFNNHGRVCP